MLVKNLYRTTTGVGVLYPQNINNEIENCINLFYEPEEYISITRKIAKVTKFRNNSIIKFMILLIPKPIRTILGKYIVQRI